MNSATDRYKVRLIATDHFGKVVFASNNHDAAKAKAEELGTLYYDGVAIIDTANQMADMGDRIVPAAKAFAPEPSDPVICHGCRERIERTDANMDGGRFRVGENAGAGIEYGMIIEAASSDAALDWIESQVGREDGYHPTVWAYRIDDDGDRIGNVAERQL